MTDTERSHTNAWPQGNGKCARLVRETDWAQTPLGPVSAWPASWRAMVDMLLACSFPMVSLWGAELVQIYNDGYAEIMGNKHPAGMGQPTRACWPEVWHINEPIYMEVQQGKTLTFENALYPLWRNGAMEDAHFTLCYSPLRDQSQAIAGVLVTVFETTKQITAEAERRQREEQARAEALRESEGRLRTTLEGIGDAFYALDRNGRFLFASRAALKIWKMELADITGRPLLAIFPGAEDSEAYRAHVRVMSSRVPEQIEAIWPVFPRWVEIHLAPRPAGGISVSFRDIEERKRRQINSALLERIDQNLALSSSPDEIMQAVGACVGEFLGLAGCAFNEVDEPQNAVTIRYAWSNGGIPELRQTYRLQNYSAEFRRTAYAHEVFVVRDTGSDGRVNAENYAALKVGAFVAVHFHWRGQWTAFLAATDVEPRDWRPDEIALLQEVANRIFPRLERARVEEALRASEEKYRTLFDTMGEGFCMLTVLRDEEGRAADAEITDLNASAERLTGIKREALIGKRLGRDFSAEDGQRWLKVWTHIADTSEPTRVEEYFAPADRWFEISGYRQGRDCVYHFYRDVSARKKSEMALRESEERYRSLFETMSQGYALIEVIRDGKGLAVDYRVLRANSAFARLTGIAAVEIEGRTGLEIVPGLCPDIPALYGRVASTGEAAHFEQEVAGLRRWYEVRAYSAGGERVTVLYEDITERKRAEQAQREREERQAFLLEFSDALRAEPDADSVTNRALEMLAEKIGLDLCFTALFHFEEDRADVTHQVRREATAPTQTTLRLSEFPGTFRQMLDRTLVFDDLVHLPDLSEVERSKLAALELGAMVAVPLRRGPLNPPLWSLTAITRQLRLWTAGEVALLEETAERTWAAVERVHAEKALRESEQRYHALFAASPVPFMVLAPNAPDFTITAANDAYLAATLTTREGVVGQRLFDAFTDDPTRPNPDGPKDLSVSLDRVLATGRTDTMPRARYDITAPGGGFERRWWRAINAPLLNAAGEVIAIVHQVTNETELHLAQVAERDNQEHQTFLLELSDALRPLSNSVAIQRTAMTLLGEHLSVMRAAYYEVEPDQDTFRVIAGYERDAPPTPNVMRMSELISDAADQYRAGATSIIPDTEALDLTAKEQAAICALGIRASAGVPLVKGGRLLAFVGIHSPVPREWTAVEISLLEDVAERTWAAVERARAETALRQSEARFRALATVGSSLVYRMSADWREMHRLDGRGFLVDTERPTASWMDTYIPADEQPRVREAINRAVRTKGAFELEHRVLGADGKVRWTFSRAIPQLDEAGEISEWFGAATDVTSRVKADQSFTRLFQGSPAPLLVIKPDAPLFTIAEVNDAHLAATMRRREDLVGRGIFEAFPENPDDPHIASIGTLRASIERVLASRRPDALPHLKYDIARPDGTFEERWWIPVNSPVLDENGEVEAIIHNANDVTEEHRAEAALRESEERYRSLFESIDEGFCIVEMIFNGDQPVDYRFLIVNPAFERNTGIANAEGRLMREIAPAHEQHWFDAYGDIALTGQARRFEAPAKALGDRWYDLNAFRVGEPEQRRVAIVFSDITQRQRAAAAQREGEERQKALVAELQHRTRNLMGVVRAMADKTACASLNLEDFRIRFQDRLEALSRVQGLLSQLNEHDRVTFDVLIRNELTAMNGSSERVALSGPVGVRLRSSSVQTLSMALHELATNAVKYGALGQPAGRLAISWSLDPSGAGGKPWLHIDWRESGVKMPPPGSAPGGTGQGRELIERALPYQLSAETSYLLGPDGVHCKIAVPVSASTEVQESA